MDVPALARPKRRGGKFRSDRGPLRWWLLVVGMATVRFSSERFLWGLACAALGVALHVFAKGCLRQNRCLCMAGPYRFSRNPFYLANLLAEIGLLIVIGNPWVAGAYLAAWFWIYRRTIAAEEAVLEELFGESYRGYRRRVPWLWPIPWRGLARSEIVGPGFSWRNPNLHGGAEYRRAARLLAFPWLLWAAAEVGQLGPTAAIDADSSALLASLVFLGLCAVGELATWAARRAARKHLGPVGANQYSPAAP